MNRRQLMRLSLAGASTGIIAPSIALAGAKPTMAGGVYYTEQAPGRWAKKVGGHLPNFELDKASGLLKILTGHEMKGFEHYIVKHVLLDANYQFIEEKMFDPMKDKAAISEHSVKGKSGVFYALSVCNKHDTWLNMIEV